MPHQRFSSFFDSNNTLYCNQFGFRRQRSTNHALHTSVTSIIENINRKKNVLGIFIDFSKAFDTISHSILLDKLDHYGIRGVALSLMKSYLSNRYQYVYFDQHTRSELQPIKWGVPQGSVLGPLLFILYVNDIIYCQCKCTGSQCVNNCILINLFVLFADDTNIFVTGNNLQQAYDNANQLLGYLKEYIDANYLHINITKSKFISFRSPRSPIPSETSFSLIYDSQPLQQVKFIKFLVFS